jgi:glutathione synthase/RimK-type ligase-like ATP-grasp enzyme
VRGVFSHIKPISAVLESLGARGAKIFDNNFLKHRYSINKVADLVKLSLANIPVPDTAYAMDFNLWQERVEEIGYPAVIKSVRTGKGANVFKVNGKVDLINLIEVSERDKKAKNF